MRKCVLWLCAACLLLAGCGAKENAAEAVPPEENVPEAVVVPVMEEPDAVAETLDAAYDFTHDGITETLELVTVPDPDMGEDLWYELWVRNGAGERIWHYYMSAGGPSWETTLFAVEADGQDCLLELITAMGQGYCSYFYEIFALDETGERLTIERDEVQFDVNFGSPIHESFDCAAIADFLWRIKELTAGADAILMDMDAADGLRCLGSPELFEHSYHCGECVAADSREEMEARIAYESLLEGNLALFAPEDLDTRGLRDWRDVILAYSELEYLYLDLDGDGGEELLVQWVDAPENYNGVFHYEDGTLTCWQNDAAEGSCRDYPLWDGTMVRQYDFDGTTTYTLFRYRADGSTKELMLLIAREGAIDPDSGEELAPSYEVDGMPVDETTFEEWLYDRLTSRLVDPWEWTGI